MKGFKDRSFSAVVRTNQQIYAPKIRHLEALEPPVAVNLD
jgi:hypothetical protein